MFAGMDKRLGEVFRDWFIFQSAFLICQLSLTEKLSKQHGTIRNRAWGRLKINFPVSAQRLW
jgi:hypothetical protein